MLDSDNGLSALAERVAGEPLLRRNRPGVTAAEWCRWPEEEFTEMEGTLAAQQFLQQMLRRDVTAVEEALSIPDGQDEAVWKYEQLRQVCLELNGLAVKLQTQCLPEVCAQMSATEQWIFLCAAHRTPQECSAVDYTRHTLDGAACLLNSNKYFPSRLTIKDTSLAKLGSICRRIYRIFSHAYYHHRELFDEFEADTFLCRRFTAFVLKFELMTLDNLIVPVGLEHLPHEQQLSQFSPARSEDAAELNFGSPSDASAAAATEPDFTAPADIIL